MTQSLPDDCAVRLEALNLFIKTQGTVPQHPWCWQMIEHMTAYIQKGHTPPAPKEAKAA